MTTRTGYVGTEAVGDVLTKANFDLLPGGLVGYNQITTFAGTITAIQDVMTVTFTAAANRFYVIHAIAPIFTQNTNAATVTLVITTNTPTQVAGTQQSLAIAGISNGFLFSPPQNTGAGSIVFRMRMSTSAGTLTPNPSATSPFMMQVYDVGPNF